MEMIKATAEGAASGIAAPVVNAARAMASAVLGDTVEAFDDYAALKVTIRSERARQRLIETIALSKRMCEEAGIDPGEVGLKVVKPILEGALIEDEDADEMHVRWAALLANASAGDEGAEVLPSFARILSELNSADARILDALTEQLTETGLRNDAGFGGGNAERAAFAVHLGNVERLGLVEVLRPNSELADLAQQLQLASIELDSGNSADLDIMFFASTETYVDLTPLGRAFLRACTPPTNDS